MEIMEINYRIASKYTLTVGSAKLAMHCRFLLHEHYWCLEHTTSRYERHDFDQIETKWQTRRPNLVGR